MERPSVNLKRIKTDIEKLAEFNATPGEGVTRLTYSKEDREARNYLIDQMKKLNMEVEIDGIGNIVGKLEGNNSKKASIMTGSHIDTVKHGGKYDGVVGVVGALETVRVIKENNISHNHPIEIVIFVEEEGATFGSTLIGSKVFSGAYTLKDIKNHRNSDGYSMYEKAKEFGLNPDSIDDKENKDIKAIIELHIEQSIVLEENNLHIGIVNDIAGIKWYEIKLEGEANHAGATPMNLRKDVMVKSAEFIKYIETVVKQSKSDSIVGTVGKINCKPNVPNVIPGEINFTLDIRDVNKKSLEETAQKIEDKIAKDCLESNINHEINLMGEASPIKLSNNIKEIAINKVKSRDYKYKVMNSGAVHDVGVLAKNTDSALLFVPSVAGKSHCPEELTPYEDIERGCNLLLDIVIDLAQ